MKFIFITLIFLFQVQSLLSQEEGCVKGDCENGTGVFVSDGIKYIGTFVNGYLHGKKEKIITPDGSVYEGKVKRGLANGKGRFFQKNGEKYIGYFKNGNYHGYGKMITVDGDYYEGEFKNDKFDGNGYIRYKDGYLYVGKFKDGKRNGEGTLYKKMYDGVWENDIRNKVD